MRFTHRNLPLKIPYFLQHHGLHFFFVLVTHHIAWIGCGNLQQLVFDVGDEFTACDSWQRYFDGFFVLHFIIFALSGNAPAAEAIDLGMRIERNGSDAIVAAAGPQDLVGTPDLDLDFVG